MAATDADLASILDHCRSLIDAADEYDRVAAARTETADVAARHWRGTHRHEFDRRLRDEAGDLANRIIGLRSEADAWARIWADTVNRLNRDRHQAAVDRVSAARGLGETVVDLFTGDDSAAQVQGFEPVPVPTARNRYAATGGLERF